MKKVLLVLTVISIMGVVQAGTVDDFSAGYSGGTIIGQTGGQGWTAGSSWVAKNQNQTANSTRPAVQGIVNAAYDAVGQTMVLSKQTDVTTRLRGTASRIYDASALGTSYALSFDITLNNIAGIDAARTYQATTSLYEDYVQAFDRNASGDDFSSDGTWLVRLGYAGDYNNGLKWRVFGGDGSGGFNQALLVAADLGVIAGDTYRVTITVDGLGHYMAAIDDLNDSLGAWTSGQLNFRSLAYTLPTGNVQFGFREIGSGATADLLPTANDIQITVDNINTMIPEPATLALLGLGGMLLRRKK